MFNSYRYDECRLYGHAWHEVPSDWNPRYGAPQTVRCERCNCERRDEVNLNTGEVEKRKYEYPDGYLYDLGEEDEAPRRVDFRLQWVRQNIDRLAPLMADSYEGPRNPPPSPPTTPKEEPDS